MNQLVTSKMNSNPKNILTLNQVKKYLRIDGDYEDDLIIDLIYASKQYAQNYLCRDLLKTTRKLTLKRTTTSLVSLPSGPAKKIDSVKIINEFRKVTGIDEDSYELLNDGHKLYFKTPVSGYRIEIIYETGFGHIRDVPGLIKQGMLSHIAQMYENRGGEFNLPPATMSAYLPYKVVRF